MTSTTVRRLAWAAGLTILTILIALAVRRLDLSRIAVELGRARPLWLAGAVGCYVASLPLWALQWTILAPPGGRNTFSNMLATVSINATVYCTGILVTGEATGVALLVTRLGLDRAAALSVVTMDQLLVGVTKLIVIGSAGFILPLPAWMRTGIGSLGGAVLALAIGVCALAWTQPVVIARISTRFPSWVGRSLTALGPSLAPLRSPPRAASAFALALAKKGCETLAIVCVQRAFRTTLPTGSALLVIAALNLTTMLPLVPGNLGTFEATIVLIYTRLGMPGEQALGMALMQHACYLVSFTLPGYWRLAELAARRDAPHLLRED